jgi:BioD-like phosphotransacetylase family protein
MKPFYIGATLQDSGKTSVSVGLIQSLIDRGLDPGYIKPVGQRYLNYFGQNIDEDAYLMHKIFDLRDRPKIMSPIAISKNFTRDFIEHPDSHSLERKIIKCAQRLTSRHKSLVIEGTGHAGVGSCFGLSNARVAQLLGAKAIIVASGGIGKPIDEIMLNLALFKQHNIEVIGVILNKVLQKKYDMITNIVGKGLKYIGTRLLGAIPHVPKLTHYTVRQVAEEFGYKVIFGKKNLHNKIANTVVLAMRPEHSVRFIRENSMVITPFDRTDSIQAALNTLKNFSHSNGGIILSGGTRPEHSVREILENSDIPVLASDEDTFTVSSRMVHLEFKITTYDTDKVSQLKQMANMYVDIDYIIQKAKM